MTCSLVTCSLVNENGSNYYLDKHTRALGSNVRNANGLAETRQPSQPPWGTKRERVGKSKRKNKVRVRVSVRVRVWRVIIIFKSKVEY